MMNHPSSCFGHGRIVIVCELFCTFEKACDASCSHILDESSFLRGREALEILCEPVYKQLAWFGFLRLQA